MAKPSFGRLCKDFSHISPVRCAYARLDVLVGLRAWWGDTSGQFEFFAGLEDWWPNATCSFASQPAILGSPTRLGTREPRDAAGWACRGSDSQSCTPRSPVETVGGRCPSFSSLHGRNNATPTPAWSNW